MSELKPCPFQHVDKEYGHKVYCEKLEHISGMYQVWCQCGYRSAILGFDKQPVIDAHNEAYNQRQPHPDSTLLEFTFKHKIVYVKHPKTNWSVVIDEKSIYGGETPREALRQAMEQEKLEDLE